MANEDNNVVVSENNNEQKQASLMKKTKAQLVDIILRKDDVEKSLRKDLINVSNTNTELSKNYDGLKLLHKNISKEYEELKDDYQRECDEHISSVCAYKDEVTKYKTYLIISFVAVIMLIIGLIC